MKRNLYKIKSGLYGLLVGDALGVPYEFHKADKIPVYDLIEFEPPVDFKRTYPNILPGTWSDDGAQALCLLESLISCGRFELNDYAGQLLEWYDHGKWAVDAEVFDVGIQTGSALIAYKRGLSPYESGLVRPDGKGNGALMRVLPLALWHLGSDELLVENAHKQCLVTHGHLCNQVCCALYCLIARELLRGSTLKDGYQKALSELRVIYSQKPDYEQELEWVIRPDELFYGEGSGYVVDCLRSALMVLERTDSYESAVRQAIALGNDTDTTACVTGGLAGLIYGVDHIPKRWIDRLRDQDKVEILLSRLTD